MYPEEVIKINTTNVNLTVAHKSRGINKVGRIHLLNTINLQKFSECVYICISILVLNHILVLILFVV